MIDHQDTKQVTQPVFYILLCLATGEKHGYQIMRETLDLSEGNIRMRNGTLYGCIRRMMDELLIQESNTHDMRDGDDERRKYYCLTSKGQQTLDAEIARMKVILSYAVKNRLVSQYE